jgi:hypothetical protein
LTRHHGAASFEILLSLDRGLSLGWLAAECTRLEQTRDLAERALARLTSPLLPG